MPRKKNTYLRQKPILYFDENFPRPIFELIKESSRIRKHFKLHSVYDFGNQGKDDDPQLKFCKTRRFVLVTLDRDFMDDRIYPIQKLPGIVVIVAGKNQATKIVQCLLAFTEFLTFVPFPKGFLFDSKFQVSLQGCLARGRDVTTREIKTIVIAPGDQVGKVLRQFGYFD
ncbi:MAG: DUF5615 family PIN-like protein [Acidobacteriaceae bacterium]|jgi:predicted nuclease of predicted toxin-antitoxin system